MVSVRRVSPFIFAGTLLAIVALAAIVRGGGVGTPASAAAKATATPPASAPAHAPGVMGTLVSASGNTLKITTVPSRTSVTVTLTTKTTYVVNGKTTKTRPTWKKGEQIQVIGSKAKNGSYTAKSVSIGAPPGGSGQGPGGPPPGGAPPVSGSIISATSSSLTVKTASSKTVFKLTSATHYVVNGKNVSSRPAFKTGEKVQVMASKSGSTYTARVVFVGSMPAPPAGGPPPGAGTSG